jgi:uncharacterized membrane protein YvlD (DUF360 family)
MRTRLSRLGGFVFAIAAVLLALGYLLTRDALEWPQFFGDKQVAMFDFWSLQHAMSGILLGWLVGRLRWGLFHVLIAAYLWEMLEWWLESGGLGAGVASWKAGHEHWANRLIADPVLVLLGARVYFYAPKIVWPAAVAAGGWFIANIISPDCMTVQKQLLGIFSP